MPVLSNIIVVGFVLPWQGMESELCPVAGGRVNLHCEIAAIVQQLDAGKGRAEPHME